MLMNILPTTSRSHAAMMTSFIPLPLPAYCITLSRCYEPLPMTNAPSWVTSGSDDSLAVRQPVSDGFQFAGISDAGTAGSNCKDSVKPSHCRLARPDSVNMPHGNPFRLPESCKEGNPGMDWSRTDVAECTFSGDVIASRPTIAEVQVDSSNVVDAVCVTGDSHRACSQNLAQADVIVSDVAAVAGEASSPDDKTIVYPLYCGTCRLRLNAPRQAKEHFEGRGHARRLKLRGQMAAHGVMTSQTSQSNESPSKQV
jgi:hypothetical protein